MLGQTRHPTGAAGCLSWSRSGVNRHRFLEDVSGAGLRLLTQFAALDKPAPRLQRVRAIPLAPRKMTYDFSKQLVLRSDIAVSIIRLIVIAAIPATCLRA